MRKTLIILGTLLVAILLVLGACAPAPESPPAEPTPTPTPTPEPEPAPVQTESLEIALVVTVPYWTEGDVYLGVGDNPAYLKLEKVNEVTYKGTAELEKGAEYYFSRGSLSTKSTTSYRTTDLPKGIHAVVDWADSGKKISLPGFQKGVTFGGMLWQPEALAVPGIIDYNLDLAKNSGIEWIIIIPDWFFDNINSSTIKPWYASDGPFPNNTNWITPTLTDEQIESIIEKARDRSMKVVLKPHVDPINWSPEYPKGRGDIQPNDWDAWYASYTNFILTYAELAQKNKVEMFVIGTEIDPAAMEGHPYGPIGGGQTQYFKNLISEVREVYSGKLTYSSACFGECWSVRGIQFWGALDYIGFEPYCSLTDSLNPTIADLKDGFLDSLKWAQQAHEKYNKPVIFTEISYHSFDGTGKYVISTPSNPTLDLQEQADAYEAVFQSIETIDWVEGIYPWALYLERPDDNLEWQLKDTDGTFIGKPAGQVLKKWYCKIED